MSNTQGFPNFSSPLVTQAGQLTPAWRQFLQNLWSRTGGASGGASGGFVAGDIKPWPGATLPDNWVACDGGQLDRTVYANLYAVLGTTWGAGNGTTSFNVPDLRGRMLIGAGQAGGLSDRTLGQTGGVEDVVLTVANLPSHTHAVTDPGHTHTITDPGHAHTSLATSSTNTAGIVAGTAVAGNTGSAVTGITVDSAMTGLTIGDTGSGTSVGTMSPFVVINWIIKL